MKRGLNAFAMVLAGSLVGNIERAAASERYSIESGSASGLLQGRLSCTEPPRIGGFQDCRLILDDRAGRFSGRVAVKVDGGMPAHRHGLPTSPVVRRTDRHGEFSVSGLRFNMPGEWLLAFEISERELRDTITFTLDVDF